MKYLCHLATDAQSTLEFVIKNLGPKVSSSRMLISGCSHFTKGSSSGATLSFALRSKGEGGQPRYLITQEIASHFITPPTPVFILNQYLARYMHEY